MSRLVVIKAVARPDEDEGSGDEVPDGRAAEPVSSVVVRSFARQGGSSLLTAKRLTKRLSASAGTVREAVLVLVLLRRVALTLDDVAGLDQVALRATEGMADAADQFLGGVPAAVLEDDK